MVTVSIIQLTNMNHGYVAHNTGNGTFVFRAVSQSTLTTYRDLKITRKHPASIATDRFVAVCGLKSV